MTETFDAVVQQNGTVLAGPPTAPYLPPHQLGTAPAYRPPIASPIPVPEPTVHVLPSGHTVTIASPRILTRGQRLALVRLARDAAGGTASGLATANAMITWLVVGWSYPFPTPAADAESLDLIPAEDDDILTELIVEPARALLFPKAPDPSDHDDPDSPTAPSGE